MNMIFFVVVALVGHWQESEGHDRVDLELPGQQLRLLQDAVTFSELQIICQELET